MLDFPPTLIVLAAVLATAIPAFHQQIKEPALAGMAIVIGLSYTAIETEITMLQLLAFTLVPLMIIYASFIAYDEITSGNEGGKE